MPVPTIHATAAPGRAIGLCALLIAAAPVPAVAQENGTLENHNALQEQRLNTDHIDGMVIDQTMTRVGREFYAGFLGTWRDLPNTDQFSFTIYERPSARWGSLIWAESRFARVYQALIQPGRASPKDLGSAAAGIVYQRLTQIEAEKLLFNDPDIAKDEL